MGEGEVELELAVLGAGYVGLVTAACLSTLGFGVRCIDRNATRINGLRRGATPFFEPGLDDALRDGVAAGRLSFATSIRAAAGADAIVIAVGTLDARGEWSSREINRAVSDISAEATAPRTIIVRSTVVPGATQRLLKLTNDRDPAVEIALNPEFTRQGSAMSDFFRPDRVVFGLTRPAADSKALRVLRRVYERVDAPVVVTDAPTAELIKVGSNVFLALKAGFANEVTRLAAGTGADAATVVNGIGLDVRIGRAYLSPGPGFGGSCLPSQSRELPEIAARLGVATPIIDALDESNLLQAEWVVERLVREVGAIDGRRVAILGLTFKAGTDDVRESPALRICRALAARGAVLAGHDPMGGVAAREAAARDGVDISVCETAAETAHDAIAAVVATEWPEYRNLDWTAIAAAMGGKTVLDTRAAVDVAAARAAGLRVIVHGRAAPARD